MVDSMSPMTETNIYLQQISLFAQTPAMVDQRKAAVCHYSIPTHILECQLQRDLPPARALTSVAQGWQTAPM